LSPGQIYARTSKALGATALITQSEYAEFAVYSLAIADKLDLCLAPGHVRNLEAEITAIVMAMSYSSSRDS
jgi:hypothetical protein